MEFGQKNFFREIDLLNFTSFFGLDFLNFSGPLHNNIRRWRKVWPRKMANWARRRLGLFFGTVEKAIGSVIFLQNWPSPKITRGVKNYKKGKEVLDWVSRAPFALLYLEKFVQIYCTMRFSAGPRGQPENWWLKSHQTSLITSCAACACLESPFLERWMPCKIGYRVEHPQQILLSWHVVDSCWRVFM